MLYTVIRPNAYQDSINLMLLTNRINELDGIEKSSIMMGTDANKDIFKNSGLLTDEAAAANPSDMVIVLDTEDEGVYQNALDEIDVFLSDLSSKKAEKGQSNEATSWEEAVALLPEANLALFSTPGEYTPIEIERALNLGLSVFSFTDNISIEDELRLKQLAHEKGLLLMGPDCGTGIISGVPLAFTNAVRGGNIGIVGASGTGIQEVSCLIDTFGGGVLHAIGTGGRDLSETIGAITTKDAIVALGTDADTDVIVVISKPPAPQVRDEVLDLLKKINKPSVAVFIGEQASEHNGNVYMASTLTEAAFAAVELAKGATSVKKPLPEGADTEQVVSDEKKIVGLYSGGTFATEAATLISKTLDLGKLLKKDGYILRVDGYDIIDLGDDVYTQGKPHPMIDPDTRIQMMREYASHEDTGIILMDCVLGYGCHPDMASALAPVIEECLQKNPELKFVVSVCGTESDIQGLTRSMNILKDAGAEVTNSNEEAIRLTLALKGKKLELPELDAFEVAGGECTFEGEASEAIVGMLHAKPKVVNVGLESFNESILEFGGQSVQYNWKPLAGGNKRMIHLLQKIGEVEGIDELNEKVIARFRESQPFLIDVVPAHTVIPEINGKVLLHAGPPIHFNDMTNPMQGSCIGAALFEGWATTEEEAVEVLANEVTYIPCHHVHAVGPMGGITSMNMPVLVIENRLDGTRAYCTMNEGIGKVLRFGAYSQEVVDRLGWMRDVLGPVLSSALRSTKEGINLNVLIAKAITMGDEFHQRNIAATLNFLKEIAPVIMRAEGDEKDKQDVVQFLADTDQFFLNIMMATGKSIVDAARKEQVGCVVTTMTRNGRDFGIRISGLGDEWFTAPVNTPVGLYFTGFSEEDGNPDIGDSSITETVGVGGMAMVAAPGVTRFVGAGGFEDALATSNEMQKICISNNSNWSIPTWDFKGTPLGIDIRKVVATGITPVINTGIAHRKAGIGQVGAGTVRAPLGCFEKALEAYAKSLGIE